MRHDENRRFEIDKLPTIARSNGTVVRSGYRICRNHLRLPPMGTIRCSLYLCRFRETSVGAANLNSRRRRHICPNRRQCRRSSTTSATDEHTTRRVMCIIYITRPINPEYRRRVIIRGRSGPTQCNRDSGYSSPIMVYHFRTTPTPLWI